MSDDEQTKNLDAFEQPLEEKHELSASSFISPWCNHPNNKKQLSQNYRVTMMINCSRRLKMEDNLL